MRRFILLSIFCGALPAWAQQSCDVGKADIYFGNGMDTTTVRAMSSLYTLRFLLNSDLLTQHSINPDCLSFSLAKDSKFIGQNNSTSGLAWALNLGLQLLQAGGNQLPQQELGQFWLWLSHPNQAPTWFSPFLILAATTAVSPLGSDLQAQVNNYRKDLNNNVKVVVVAHSQGNFYANEAFGSLSASSNQFSLVSVATPANNVLGKDAPYVTLDHDIILLVPGSLPWDVSNDATSTGVCSPKTLGLYCSSDAHDFQDSYLFGSNSETMILNDVIDSIPIVLGVSTSGSGTVTSSPTGINCGATCNAAFPGGTSVTLTATPAASQSFTGWSGNCSSLATAGGGTANSITFPVKYDPTGAVITSYPENCTATFASATPGIVMTLPIPLQVPITDFTSSSSGGTGTGYYQINVNYPSTGPDVSLIGSGQQITFHAQISPGFKIVGVSAAFRPDDVWTDYCPGNPNANNSTILGDVAVSSSISASGQTSDTVVTDKGGDSCLGVVNLTVSINYAVSAPN
jgi:hypothetical protein